MPPPRSHPRRRPSTSPFHDAPQRVHDEYQVDSRVVHDRHGVGRVLRVVGERMDVQFGSVVVDVDTSSEKVHLL